MQQTNKSKKPPLRRAASTRPCNDGGGVHVWCMCSVVKGLHRARSTDDDLLLSGARAHPASTIVHPKCLDEPISNPTGALRCVAHQTNNLEIPCGPQYFFKSELIRRQRVVMQHSEDHSVVPTGRRAIDTAIHRAQAPLILASLGRSCLCQRFFEKKRLQKL